MKKRYSALLAMSLSVAVLAGCGSTSGPETSPSGSSVPSSEADSDIGTDGSIVAYVGTNIFDSSLDPIKGAMSYGYSFTNAALIKVDQGSSYVGDMATDWSISEDALVYTFKLRDGVRFSDGSVMTAEDVVFTYQSVQENQAHNENIDLSRLASVMAEDEHTVVFTLTEAYSPFLDTTAMLGIVPSDGYDSTAFDQVPIGTGPWKVVQYDPNQQIIVEPNEYYYEGVASIGRITLVYMDNDAALSAARSGQLDVVMVNPNYADQTVDGMTMVALETMDIRNVSLPVNPETEHEGQTVGNDVTFDPAVREALAIGIDRATIIEHAFNGVGKPATGFTDNLVWASGATYEDNRRAEAISLLESAGWVDEDGDGIRERDGISCEFDVYAAEDRYVLAAALAEDVRELGIKINPHSSSWDEISDNMNTSAVIWGWGQYSPTVLASLFDSSFAYTGGYDNVVAYQNPDVDQLIANALAKTDQAAAVAEWQAVQTLADADFPYLYIVNIEHCYFVSDKLNISVDTQIPHPHGHGSPIICNMKDWTLK